MHTIYQSLFTVIIASFLVTACSSTPEPKKGAFHTTQEQKTNGKEAQRELSSETHKK